MARAGDELVNQVTGLLTVFRKTARQTSGELLQVDWIGEPGWTTGPDHVHPRQEERFEVLSGKLGLRVEGVERVLGEGEAITAPAGSAHPPPDPPFGGCSSTRPGGTLLGKSCEWWLCAPVTGVENRRRRDTELIRVTVEIRDGALTYRVRVTATSIERALEIAGEGKPGRRVRLVFPIDPDVFFVPAASGTRREAA